MQDECPGFWSFPIFTLNQAFIKDIWKKQVLNFFGWHQKQNIILTSTTAVEPSIICQRYGVYWQSNQKLIHHYQYVNTIQSICSIHQIICEIQLILESHDLKGLTQF